jgi:hypothetical protein
LTTTPDPVPAPVPAPGGPVAEPLRTVQELLRSKPYPAIDAMEALLARLERTDGAEEAIFLLVRAMSRIEPRFHVRLGAFFDPNDNRPKGEARVNAMYAYDEYSEAGDLPEAKAKIQALSDWLGTPAAEGVDGADELRAKLGQ